MFTKIIMNSKPYEQLKRQNADICENAGRLVNEARQRIEDLELERRELGLAIKRLIEENDALRYELDAEEVIEIELDDSVLAGLLPTCECATKKRYRGSEVRAKKGANHG